MISVESPLVSDNYRTTSAGNRIADEERRHRLRTADLHTSRFSSKQGGYKRTRRPGDPSPKRLQPPRDEHLAIRGGVAALITGWDLQGTFLVESSNGRRPESSDGQFHPS